MTDEKWDMFFKLMLEALMMEPTDPIEWAKMVEREAAKRHMNPVLEVFANYTADLM